MFVIRLTISDKYYVYMYFTHKNNKLLCIINLFIIIGGTMPVRPIHWPTPLNDSNESTLLHLVEHFAHINQAASQQTHYIVKTSPVSLHLVSVTLLCDRVTSWKSSVFGDFGQSHKNVLAVVCKDLCWAGFR